MPFFGPRVDPEGQNILVRGLSEISMKPIKESVRRFVRNYVMGERTKHDSAGKIFSRIRARSGKIA